MSICEKCNGLKWIIEKNTGKVKPCDCLRLKKEEIFFLPPHFKNCSFENFHTYKQLNLLQAKKIAEEFAKKFPLVDYGILFVGPNGVGKTHLACAILNKIQKEKGLNGLFVDFSNLSFKLKDKFGSFEDETMGDLVELMVETPILLLDDLGSIKSSQWYQDVIYEIINQRYLKNKVMILTTAYQIQEEGERENLYSRIGDALVSRILEVCKIVEIQAKDHRKEVFQVSLKHKK